MKPFFNVLAVVLLLLGHGVFADELKSVSVMEGDSVTLQTNVTEIQKDDEITWTFGTNRNLLAETNGASSEISIYDGPDGIFKDRLKLDKKTGSLTITNIRTEHAGHYEVEISSSRSESKHRFIVTVYGAFGVGSEGVSVCLNEGDSVTLNTGVQTNQQEDIKWYFNSTRIAQISGDLSYICTDVQCNEGTERFRDRLKLDHQTGSLTIMKITNTHSGEYKLKIIFSSSDSEKIFSVSVHGVSAAERDEVKTVEEGESVTLDPGVIKSPNDEMMLYFNETVIAEIAGDQSKICTDDRCKERFRDRLKLDHQTGSLTIMNTRNTDSGEYKLKIIINNSSFSISRMKRFNVTVTAAPGSDLSSGAVAGIVVAVLLVFAAAAGAVVYCRRRIHTAVPQNEHEL